MACSKLSSVARGQGALKCWHVVKGGARSVGRGQITESQVCFAKSQALPGGSREAVVGPNQHVGKALDAARVEAGPSLQQPQQPGKAPACQTGVQTSDPNVLFCQTSRISEKSPGKLASFPGTFLLKMLTLSVDP